MLCMLLYAVSYRYLTACTAFIAQVIAIHRGPQAGGPGAVYHQEVEAAHGCTCTVHVQGGTCSLGSIMPAVGVVV